MKHAELIARLEAAEMGSDDLDCAVHDAITGEENIVHGVYDYTTSLDAALALAERLGLDACELLFNVLNEGEFRVDRLPLALCIAILRALDNSGDTA